MAVRPPSSTGTFAVTVLFFLIGVATARTSSILHVDEVPAADADVNDFLTVPTSEIKQILRLPTDSIAGINVNDESSQPNPDPESAEPITVRSVPLTRVRFHDFRPINRRHVSDRVRLPNRLSRHHHGFRIEPLLKPVDENMLPLNSDGGDEKKELELEKVNWIKLPYHHHHHHRHHHRIYRHQEDDEDGLDGFSKYLMKRSYKFGKNNFKKHLNHKRRDHDDDDDEEVKTKKRGNGKKEAEVGFVQRVRKFLIHI